MAACANCGLIYPVRIGLPEVRAWASVACRRPRKMLQRSHRLCDPGIPIRGVTRTDSPVGTFPVQGGPAGQDLAVRGDPPYGSIRHIPFDTHLEAQRAQNTRRANRTAAEIFGPERLTGGMPVGNS